MYPLVTRDFETLLDRVFTTYRPEYRNGSITTNETEDDYTLSLEVPGIPQSMIDISLDAGVLKVSASVSKDESVDGVERSLSRVWTLPRTVKQEDITAMCKDGVLLLKLPKAKKPPAKAIPILS